MSYPATVYRVLIASPSDVEQERAAIRDLVYQWNDVYSPSTGVVLLPVLWETHAVPQMGDRPQGIINRQLVENADLLIGVFWTKLGTHTGQAESGTAEEIEAFRQRGKPVLLYFSSAPVVPGSIDFHEFQRLQEYKQRLQSEGLLGEYSTLDELRVLVNRHLAETVNQMRGTPAPTAGGTPSESDDLRSALVEIVRRAQINWEAERDSQPVNVDEAKYTIELLSDNLVEFLIAAQDSIDQQTVERLRSAITEARDMQHHRMYLDGGVSYREFWTRGDALLADLNEVVQSFTT